MTSRQLIDGRRSSGMKQRSILLWTTLLLGVASLWGTTNDFIPGEGFNTLHLTPSGELRQILWRGTNLIYRAGAIGNWEEEVVSTTDYPVTPPSPIEADESNYRYRDQAVLLLDSTGAPHVFVQRWIKVEHFWRDPGGWQAEDLTPGWSSSVWPLHVTRNLAVAVGPGDTFHLVINDCYVTDQGRLLYASNKTGVWEWEVALPSLGNPAWFQYTQSQYAPRMLAVAADSSNRVCVTFCPRYNYPDNPDGTCRPYSELHCALNRSGTWRDELVNAPADLSGDAGLGASIALGPDQQPRIASLYLERVDTGSPQYAQLLFHTRNANGTWTKEVIASSAAGYVAGDGNEGTGFAPYLRYDSAGVPHIAFSDFASQHFWFGADEFAGQIRYAKKVGASWSIQTIFAQTDPLRNMLNYPVLAVGSNQLFFAGLQRTDYLDGDLMIIDQQFNLLMFDQSGPSAPFITTQPMDQCVLPGGTTTNRVVAMGSAPLKYQWRRGTANLLGATDATLVLTNFQSSNAGGYSVVVSNSYGSVTSSPVSLAVSDLFIASQPFSRTNKAGTAATFGVGAGSVEPISYQWRKGAVSLTDGWKVSGSASAMLTLSDVVAADAGGYSVVVSSSHGSVTSLVATLTVLDPSILSQPTSQNANEGESVELSVEAGGTPPLTYQWRFYGTNLPARTDASLDLENVTADQAGPYLVVVSSACGAITSVVATLRVWTLGEALNAAQLPWISGGDAPWTAQYTETHDGQLAAQSGYISGWGETWVETHVLGPGTLSFWWKIQTYASDPRDWYDRLEFYTNGTVAAEIVRDADWAQRTYSLGAGQQTLRWNYYDVGSMAPGQGWLDQVTFTPSPGPPFIVTQPANQTVELGGTATFVVLASGGPAPSYQWRFYGTNLPAQTGASLVLAGVTTNQAGLYVVVLTNTYGSVTSAVATLTVVPVLTLGEALDAPQLVWSSGGNAPWTAQTAVTHDGMDAAQSGPISNSQETWMETSVVGPGPLSFWWRVSSESGYDYLEFYTNSVRVTRIAGEVNWQQLNYTLGGGTHVLRWRYMKDSTDSDGQDRGWVDQMTFTPPSGPPVMVGQPTNQTVEAGGTVTFAVTATGALPLAYQWRFYGTNLPSQTNANLGLTAVTIDQAGPYSVVVTNPLGSVTSSLATLTVVPVLTLAEAVDAPQLTWSSGGNASWRGQTAVTHDGVDAAQSGMITDSQETWMETTVVGPGPLSFWWKVSSESGWDYLEFRTNGVLEARVSGEANWAQHTCSLRAGVQTLRWRYMKDGSGTSGQDRGWVDQVTFTPPSDPPLIVGQPTNQTVEVGGTGTFLVSVSGGLPLSYQWRFYGTNLPGQTDAILALPSVTTNQAGPYVVVVTNASGSVTSAVALLAVSLSALPDNFNPGVGGGSYQDVYCTVEQTDGRIVVGGEVRHSGWADPQSDWPAESRRDTG